MDETPSPGGIDETPESQGMDEMIPQSQGWMTPPILGDGWDPPIPGGWMRPPNPGRMDEIPTPRGMDGIPPIQRVDGTLQPQGMDEVPQSWGMDTIPKSRGDGWESLIPQRWTRFPQSHADFPSLQKCQLGIPALPNPKTNPRCHSGPFAGEFIYFGCCRLIVHGNVYPKYLTAALHKLRLPGAAVRAGPTSPLLSCWCKKFRIIP